MRTYLTRIAGALNAVLLVFVLYLVKDVSQPDGKGLLIMILSVVTPAFTLVALFAPTKE
jgi:hypothetical protein